MELNGLKTRIVGKRILFIEEIDSTNEEARRLAKLGEKEGTVVIAASQTKGKGRAGNRWISPNGGLYISIILKPYVSSSRLPMVTLFSAVAAVRTIRGLTGLNASVKWPNDIIISGRKAGGILCEAAKNFIIVGIGINLNTNLGVFPSALKKQVTSLKFELGANVGSDKITKILLEEFDKLYNDFLHHRSENIISEWSGYCRMLGSPVRIETLKGAIEGIAESLGSRGELRVRGYDGKIIKVFSGDVIKVNPEHL